MGKFVTDLPDVEVLPDAFQCALPIKMTLCLIFGGKNIVCSNNQIYILVGLTYPNVGESRGCSIFMYHPMNSDQ